MELAPLVNLQDVDKKILALEMSLGGLPQEVDSLRSDLNQLEDDIATINRHFNECQISRRKLEGDIEMLQGKLKKYQEQVYAVTTNKEYDAISTEIENTKETIENNETNLLESLEKEDELKNQLLKEDEQQQQLTVILNEKVAILNQKLKENEAELSRLQQLRKEYVQQIDKPLYANYERIRKARNGVALSEIDRYTCRECFATIPAQTVVEVRKMNSIIVCETCGRILVHTNSLNKKPVNTISSE